jgi:hypothetical protein
VAEVPWEALDLLLRRLEAERGLNKDGRRHELVLLRADEKPGPGDKWTYALGDSNNSNNKELEEARFQPDAKKK